MAQRIQTLLIDDLDGGEAAGPGPLPRLRSVGQDEVPDVAIANADCDGVGPACEAFPLGQA